MAEREYTYTVAQLGEKFKTSENSIRKALRKGEIPYFKIGHRYIIPAAKIDAMLGLK